jgi:hypothetical protein
MASNAERQEAFRQRRDAKLREAVERSDSRAAILRDIEPLLVKLEDQGPAVAALVTQLRLKLGSTAKTPLRNTEPAPFTATVTLRNDEPAPKGPALDQWTVEQLNAEGRRLLAEQNQQMSKAQSMPFADVQERNAALREVWHPFEERLAPLRQEIRKRQRAAAEAKYNGKLKKRKRV